MTFKLPAEAAEPYTKHVAIPRVQELIDLLEVIRAQFAIDGLDVGPLVYRVESEEDVPRMPVIDEASLVSRLTRGSHARGAQFHRGPGGRLGMAGLRPGAVAGGQTFIGEF